MKHRLTIRRRSEPTLEWEGLPILGQPGRHRNSKYSARIVALIILVGALVMRMFA